MDRSRAGRGAVSHLYVSSSSSGSSRPRSRATRRQCAACSWLGLPFSADCFRCRRPGLPAARGGSPARAGSAAIPRVRAQESTAADQVQEALLSKLSHLPRECALVRAAATLRARASRALGHKLVRPQLAYKSTSNLVNFPQSGRSGALSAVWQFSKLFRKPRPGTPTTRARAARLARLQLDSS